MSVAINISQKDLVVSKKLPTFVVPNRAKIIESEHYTYLAANNKAGFLRQFYFDSLARFGDFQGRLASFCTYIPNFFLKMPNRGKVSSASTKCARTARPTVRKSVQPSCAKVAPNLYQIKMDLVASYSDEGGCVRHIGVIHTDIYQAANEDEAIGIALISARKKYGLYHNVDLRSIERTCTYRNITPLKP